MQTHDQRCEYQNTRTRDIKAANEAARTPKIRELQRREAALDRKWQSAKTQEERDRISEQHGEVWALLLKMVQPLEFNDEKEIAEDRYAEVGINR
jgi:Tfp pilus assembly protein PilN